MLSPMYCIVCLCLCPRICCTHVRLLNPLCAELDHCFLDHCFLGSVVQNQCDVINIIVKTIVKCKVYCEVYCKTINIIDFSPNRVINHIGPCYKVMTEGN